MTNVPTPHFEKNGSADNYDSSKAITNGFQDSLKVWVFEQALSDAPKRDNLPSLKLLTRGLL